MIRRAEDKDIPQVLHLLEQVNRVHHEIRPDLFRLATKYTGDELRRIFTDDDAPVFVYEENGQVCGYIFTVLLDHSRNHMLTPIKELYIDDLCVDEAARGRGVATALYRHVLDFAKRAGCHNVTLNVWSGNDGALAFYQKMGMQPQKTKLETVIGGENHS